MHTRRRVYNKAKQKGAVVKNDFILAVSREGSCFLVALPDLWPHFLRLSEWSFRDFSVEYMCVLLFAWLMTVKGCVWGHVAAWLSAALGVMYGRERCVAWACCSLTCLFLFLSRSWEVCRRLFMVGKLAFTSLWGRRANVFSISSLRLLLALIMLSFIWSIKCKGKQKIKHLPLKILGILELLTIDLFQPDNKRCGCCSSNLTTKKTTRSK